jgi:putative aldouronate transport system substrate-binding protein
MKSIKRVLVLLIVAAVLPTYTISATGAAETGSATTPVKVSLSGFPIVDQPITLTATALQGPSARSLDEMPLYADLEDKTNIDIEWQMIPSASATEKINLIIAGQDYPDFFYHEIPTLVLPQTLGDQGVVVPLNKYLDTYAPNYTALLSEFPDIRTFTTNPDGNIYAFSRFLNLIDLVSAGNRPYINLRWLEKLNLDMPKSPDDFYRVLKAFKTQDPNGNGKTDEIPLSLLAGAGDVGDISNWIALFGAWGVVYETMVINGQVELGHMQPGFKEGLKFFNKLFEEGLLDPESFTQNASQLRAKTTVEDIFHVGAFRSFVSWQILDIKHSLYYKGFNDGTANPDLVFRNTHSA